MAAIDLSQFHKLAEHFRGEKPLKKIYDQEGVNNRAYIAWRSKSKNGMDTLRTTSYEKIGEEIHRFFYLMR